MKCFKCGQTGHKADACRNEVSKVHQATCVYAPSKDEAEAVNDELPELKSGKKMHFVGAAMTTRPTGTAKGMPTLKGKVCGKKVTVLRDSGCTTVIVRKKLV